MQNNSINIVVIDSGINTESLYLKKHIVFSTRFYFGKNGEIIEDTKNLIQHEHGTMVALIIRYMCENIKIYSLNILDDKLKSDGRILIYAMKKALQLKPDIIHLSLGTRSLRYWFSLKNIIAFAKKQHTIIVSAADNKYGRAFPACMCGVIGVKYEGLILKNKTLNKKLFDAPCSSKYIENSGIFKSENKYLEGNSAAAAYMTGYIAKYLIYKKNNINLNISSKHINLFNEVTNYLQNYPLKLNTNDIA